MPRRAQRLAPWGKLLGLAPLGRGQGGGVAGPDQFGDPPYYLVNDTFTTNRAAGVVNGTDAEPGPGRRVVVDGNSKLSLIGGSAVFATGGVGVGDPGLWYASSFLREVGVVGLIQAAYTVGGIEAGFDAGQSGAVTDCLRLTGTSISMRSNGGALVAVGAAAAATAYTVALATRANGYFYFIKGGAFTNWTLLWSSATVTGGGRYPSLVVIGNTSVATSAYIRVPATRWLPVPLLSDGFSAWGTSDGLGHAEGIAGGLGSGGGGLAMTAYVGSWGAAGGVASCSALTGGVGLAGRDVGTADMIATVKVTRAGGVAGLFVRENADDRVMAVHNGTNAQLIKRVASVDTTLINTAATYVAGAELRLICQGTAFRLFYNNVAIGSEQTISDVSLQAETLAGIYTTDTGNTFDDLVVRARGSGGEYTALDAF